MRKEILRIYGILIFFFIVLLVLMLFVYGPKSTESIRTIRVVLKDDVSAGQRVDFESYLKSMPGVISVKYMTSQERMDEYIEQLKKRVERNKKLVITQEQMKEMLNGERIRIKSFIGDQFAPAEYITAKIKDTKTISRRLQSRPEIATKRVGRLAMKEIFTATSDVNLWNKGVWKTRAIVILSYVASLTLMTALLVIISFVLKKPKDDYVSMAGSDETKMDLS